MAGRGRRSAAAAGDAPARRCNLERFLEATTPVVTSSCSAKESKNGWRQSDADDSLPFFTLCDLWDSFTECSAYGLPVPIVLNGCRDEIVQYYVPYLSAIQLYGGFRRHVGASRTSAEESDSQDTGSDLEHETSSSTNAFSAQETSETSSSSEDEGESAGNCHEQLLFEFVESESPYQREPLADKICSLAKRFPELKSLRSCDLSPASWISVAWYPIYRIPTGPTLRDLDACFLTYHSLSTQFAGVGQTPKPKCPATTTAGARAPAVTAMWLPAFATVSYKLKAASWTPAWRDRQLAASLAQAADSWLRLLRADHPDHRFFASRRAPRR